jgi:hypothetical protein
MSDYLSGRELNLKIGVTSYTESNTVLEVIGKSDLGITSVTELTARGPVFIGTETSSKIVGPIFQVSGNNSSSYIGGRLGIGSTPAADNIGYKFSVEGGNIRFSTQNEGDVFINHNDFVTSILANSAVQLALGAGNREAIRINRSGLVGIGTVSPLSKLHVVGGGITTGEALQVDGNIRVGNSVTSNYIAFRGVYGDGAPGTTPPIDQVPYSHAFIGERIYEPGTEKTELLLFKGNDVNSPSGPDRIRLASTGSIVFDTTSVAGLSGSFDDVGASANFSTKMSLTSSGRLGIGIGTAAALELLDVNGPILSRNGAFIVDGSSTNANTDHIWHNDGSAGVNTGFNYYGFGGGWNFVSDAGYKTTGNSWLIGGGFSNGIPGLGSAYPLQITGNSYISGNVGLGITNPQATLDVQGTAKIQAGIGTTRSIWNTTSDARDYTASGVGLLVQPDNVYNVSAVNTGITTYEPVVFSHALSSSNGNYDSEFRSFNNFTNVAGTASSALVDAIGIYNRVGRGSTTDISSNANNMLTGSYNHVIQSVNVDPAVVTRTVAASWNTVGIRKAAVVDAIAEYNNTNVGTGVGQSALVSNVYGTLNYVGVGNTVGFATITNYFGYFLRPVVFPTGRIVNYYGIYLVPPVINTGGSITNRYSIYSLDPSSPMYHAGNLGIGITNPTSKLHVQGNVLVSGIVSATAFYGNGQNITDLIGQRLSGISVYNEGDIVEAPFQYSSLNFVGTYVTATGINSTATLTFSSPEYSITSGVSTNVIGGIASVTNLNVTDALGTVRISSGIVTATKFVGDGSDITGISVGSLVGVSTYAINAGVATYSVSSGVATYATNAGVATYSVSSGVATYSASSGVATYATNAGVATYATNAGVATYATNAGFATVAETARNISGGVQGSVLYQKSSGVTTVLNPGLPGQILITNGDNQDPIWGNVSGAVGAFGGITIKEEGTTVGSTSNITTINFVGPNITASAVSGAGGIATVTVADYVTVSGYAQTTGISTVARNLTGSPNITVSSVNSTGIITAPQFNSNVATGTAPLIVSSTTVVPNLNAQYLNGQLDIYYTNASNLASGLVPGARINASAGNFTVGQNLFVTGTLSVGGTSVILNAATLQISDKDIVVGYTTDANGNDISSDNTANHGGISVASTEGSPLIIIPQQLGVNSTPATYKQLMWVKRGNYSGFGTDAWLFNYGVSIGNTASVQFGSRLTVGAGFTVYDTYLDAQDIKSKNIFSSGIVTATSFVGNLTGNATKAGYSDLSGISTNVIGGIASVTSLNVSGIGTTIPVRIGTGSSIVVIDSSGEVGIGISNPQYPLDVVGNMRVTGNIFASNVISLDANVGEIVRTNAGIVSTNSLNTIVIDTYNTALYRSAKYTIQVSSNGSLIPGTTSISSITGGTNYFPGTYNSQDIVAGAGVGSYGKATLTVVPEFSLAVNSCIDGVYTAATNLPSGITTNKTVYWTQNQNLSQRQQSQISSFLLATSGIGYTIVPTLTVDAPIIANNQVPEVGVGSTARLSVVSMRVTNAVQTSAGFVTNIVPTVTFSGPSIGVTALGLVSFGISAINVTNPGSGYTFSPSVTIAAPYNPTGFDATVGLGISTLNWVISGGSGYTDPQTVTVAINPVGGVGTGAVINGVSVGSTIQFSITNPGFGYTTPPTILVSGGSGSGAGVTISRMIVSNITVNNPGSGVTVGLARTNDFTISGGGVGASGAGATVATLVSTGVTITNSGFGYTSTTIPTITYNPLNAAISQVGLGISAIQQLSTGIGYTVVPNVTISPGPSVGTTVNAGISTTLGYSGFAGTTIIAGPAYGTTSVYYINVLSNRTFSLTTDRGSALIPGISTVGYGFSVGLSTVRTGTVAFAGTTIITGGITTTGITVGTPVQNNTIITPGTTVSSIGIGSVFLSLPALNTSTLSASFNFGSTLIVGGKVNAVNITNIVGSGYVALQTNTAKITNFDRASTVYDTNVGTGFTFTVSNIVNNFQVSEILTLHSIGSGSSTAYLVEQAGIADVAELGEFSASLGTGSTVYNLNFTPSFAFNTVKFNKTLFTV